MTPPDQYIVLRANFHKVTAIIQAEEMWERVPPEAREYSPRNLEKLVQYAYFGGFIDMAAVRQLLLIDKKEARRRLVEWYEEVRQKGCWLC
jgi:hypothetical protein